MPDSETTKAILEDLRAKNGTHGEIAKRHGYSVRTVSRLVRKHGLYYGRGKKNHWHFTESNKHLTYFVGAFLSDGAFAREYKRATIRGIQIHATSDNFLDAVKASLGVNNLPSSKSEFRIKQGSKGFLPQAYITCHSSDFAQWLHSVTDNKSRIPEFIFQAPVDHKVAFISGLIDGDGRVTAGGTIVIRCCADWMHQLPDLLKSAGIGTTGCHFVRQLPSGKTYWRVNVTRRDFREKGGKCAIPEKQERIMYARDTRRGRPCKKYPCRVCGQETVARKDGRCAECYHSSKEFHDHIKAIAPAGNKAANRARWGYNHEEG